MCVYKIHAFIFRGRPPKWSGTPRSPCLAAHIPNLSATVTREIESLHPADRKRPKMMQSAINCSPGTPNVTPPRQLFLAPLYISCAALCWFSTRHFWVWPWSDSGSRTLEVTCSFCWGFHCALCPPSSSFFPRSVDVAVCFFFGSHHPPDLLFGFWHTFLQSPGTGPWSWAAIPSFKRTAQQDLRGSKVVWIDRSPFKLPILI
jgi:hypothetical protein